MSDEISLMREVVARPDDDLPRLVYADWLEERGKALLGEFIRTQIEITRSPLTRPVVYLTEYEAPAGDDKFVRGKIKNLQPERLVDYCELLQSQVDWSFGPRVTLLDNSSDYWSLRGSGIFHSWGLTPLRGRAGVARSYDLELAIIPTPTTGPDDHWPIRDRLQKLLARQAELWQEPEVFGHYASQEYFSSCPVLHWGDLVGVGGAMSMVESTGAVLGLVRRGMIEEVKLPIDQWTAPVTRKCRTCEGVGSICQGYSTDEYEQVECESCPTFGQLIVQAHPVKKVWALDREPYPHILGNGDSEFHWYDLGRRGSYGTEDFDDFHPSSNLPSEIYQKLSGGEPSGTGFRVYTSEVAAADDLSQALLSLANPKAA